MKRKLTNQDNAIYMNKFLELREGMTQTSTNQYTLKVGQLMNSCDKDIMTLTADELKHWRDDGNKSKINHVRGFMLKMIENDVNSSQAKVSKDMLIYLATNK